MFRERPVTPIHVMIAKGNDKAVKSVSIVPSVAVKSTDDTYAYINKAAMNPITDAIIFFFQYKCFIICKCFNIIINALMCYFGLWHTEEFFI